MYKDNKEKSNQELWDDMDVNERNAAMTIFEAIHEAIGDTLEEVAKMVESHSNRNSSIAEHILIQDLAKEIRGLKS